MISVIPVIAAISLSFGAQTDIEPRNDFAVQETSAFVPSEDSTVGDLYRHFDPDGFNALPEEAHEAFDNTPLSDAAGGEYVSIETGDWSFAATAGYLYKHSSDAGQSS